MKTALFTNYSDKEFIGYWNGKPRTYPPGKSELLPLYLAEHFAKHLANREVLKLKGGERMTSPKRPKDVPEFQALMDKGCIVQKSEEDATLDKQDPVEMQIAMANKNQGDESTVIEGPKDDDEFENQPKDEEQS